MSLYNTILEHLSDPSFIFVFPTKIEAQLWADCIIRNENHADDVPAAVNMEQFLDWSEFKQKFIKDTASVKRPVTGIERKIFVSSLIEENKEKHFFKSLITENEEVLKHSDSFISYLSGIIPSLQLWSEAVLDGSCNFKSDYEEADEEDRDLLELYRRYSDYLDENNMYDSAWEKPPFVSKDNEKYLIFYPEILQDWYAYRKLLEDGEKNGMIQLMHVPEMPVRGSPECKNLKCRAEFYKSSVTEVREIAAYIRQKHDCEKIAWSDIILSVPDIESYGPYLKKELELLDIPVSIRSGKPLSSYAAGRLFEEMLSCKESNFSFASLKVLLMNVSIPWRNPYKIRHLMNFGQMNKCFVSTEDEDIWMKSFKDQSTESELYFDNGNVKKEDIENFYIDFKSAVLNLVNSRNFIELNENFIIFSSKFLRSFDSYQKDYTLNEKILQNCKKIIGSLADSSQKTYGCINPFIFYVNYLQGESYVEMESLDNVQILPYKTVAAAPVKVNIIAGATQDSLSLTKAFKPLSFITDDEKRQKILKLYEESNGMEGIETDPTNAVIHLYELNSTVEALFTGSEHSWSGYGYEPSELMDLLAEDKNSASEEQTKTCIEDSKKRFAEIYRKSSSNRETLDNWKSRQKNLTDDKVDSNDFYAKALKKIRDREDESFYKLSASTMKAFWKCPQKWLFDKVLYLEEPWDPDAIIDVAEMGTIRHRIFELYVGSYKDNPEGLPGKLDEEKLEELVDKAIEEGLMDENPEEKYFSRKSVSAKNKLLKMKPELISWLTPVLQQFCKEFVTYEVIGCELGCDCEINDITPDHNVRLTGSIDCVLRHKDSNDIKKYVIIDYKSSRSSIPENRLTDPENPDKVPDMQMPLYIYFLRNVGYRAGNRNVKISFEDIDRCSFMNLYDGTFVDCINLGKIKATEDAVQKALSNKNAELEKRFPGKTEAEAEYSAEVAEAEIERLISQIQEKHQDFNRCQKLLDGIIEIQRNEYENQKAENPPVEAADGLNEKEMKILANIAEVQEYRKALAKIRIENFDADEYPCRESDCRKYENFTSPKVRQTIWNYYGFLKNTESRYENFVEKADACKAELEAVEKQLFDEKVCASIKSNLPAANKLLLKCKEYSDYDRIINDFQNLISEWKKANKTVSDWKKIAAANDKIQNKQKLLDSLRDDYENFESVCGDMKNYISKFCRTFENHDFGICRANQDADMCGKCSYRSLCRNYFEVSGREIPETLTEGGN